MRYRIILNPDTTKWTVQLSKLGGVYWQTVKREFDSFYQASNWCADTGIDEAYFYQDARGLQHAISGNEASWQTKQTAQTNEWNQLQQPNVLRSKRVQSTESWNPMVRVTSATNM